MGMDKITCSRYLDLAKMNRQRHIAPDRIYLHMHIWPEISAFLSGPFCLGVCRSVNILLIFESRHRWLPVRWQKHRAEHREESSAKPKPSPKTKTENRRDADAVVGAFKWPHTRRHFSCSSAGRSFEVQRCPKSFRPLKCLYVTGSFPSVASDLTCPPGLPTN